MSQIHTGKTLRPLLILIGIAAIIGLGLMINRVLNPPPEPGSAAAMLGREHRMLVLRLPPDAQGQQEQLIVHENTQFAPYPRRVTRSPVRADSAPDTVLDLSLAEWQPLDVLRSDWCFTSPLFGSPQQGEPVYEVAVRCGASHQQAIIPADQLPSALEHLVEQVSEQ